MSEDFATVRTRIEHSLRLGLLAQGDDVERALAEIDRLTRCLDVAGYVTPYEVADRLRVSKMTVYRLIESGELAAIRVGRSYRVHAAAFTDFVASKAVAGGGA